MTTFPQKPSVDNMKKQIFQAYYSYHNDYDVIAELLQNAVDAIYMRKEEKKNGYQGRISILINADKREIIVHDNGVGMSPNQLDKAVQFYESEKMNDKNTVGEKGIGLSFAIFQSNSAKITTNNGINSAQIVAIGARGWAESESIKPFNMPIENSPETSLRRGTEVILSGLRDNSFFSLNYEQLVFTIRTHTAIGNTLGIWRGDRRNNLNNIKVKLTYINEKKSINYVDKSIDFSYHLLDDIDDNRIVSMNEFEDKFKDANNTDIQKIDFLRGKYVTESGEHKIANRTFKYFVYFTPTTSVWKERSEHLNLISSEEPGKFETEPEYSHFKYGITMSVKGMPTGINLNTDSLRGMSGYIPRMFMIIEDAGLNFDIGRKTIAGSTTNSYNKVAIHVFQKYRKIAQKWMARDYPKMEKEDRTVKFNQLKKLPNLSGDTAFSKVPEQEGSLSGIFFEQLGKGKFQGLSILQHGYKDVYDLYANYKDADIVLEFKQHLRSFLSEAIKDRKRWQDVNYLVLYDVDDLDKRIAAEEGVSLLQLNFCDSAHLNASLTMSSQFTDIIYVILLKNII